MSSIITRNKLNSIRMVRADSLRKEKRNFIRKQNRLIKNVLSGIYDEELIAATAPANYEEKEFQQEEKETKSEFNEFMSKYFPYEDYEEAQSEIFTSIPENPSPIANFDVESYMSKHYPKNYDGPYPLIGDKAEEFAATAAANAFNEESPLKKRKINFDEEKIPKEYVRPKNYAAVYLKDDSVLVQNFKKHNSTMKVHYDKELDCFYDYKESRLYPTLQEASKAHCDLIGIKYPVNAWRKFKLLNKDGTLSSIERLDLV